MQSDPTAQKGSPPDSLVRSGSCVLLGAALFALLLAGCTRTPETQLSALLVTLDTTRADRLGCYGYPLPTSPVLDRLAAEGVLFWNAIAPASVTNTVHASIFTGLEPYNHGVRSMVDQRATTLEDSHVTLAEVLRDTGFRTAAFVSATPAAREFGFMQGFELFDDDFARGGRIEQRRGDQTTDLVIDWLTAVDEPFFGWVHLFDPHDAKLMPPQELLDSFKPERWRDRAIATRAVYDAEVRFMDQQIGRLLEALDQRGLRERTVVIVVADHGEGLGDHDWWPHGLLYQEQIRVPLILSLPGGPNGLRIDPLVRLVDLAPSLLNWLAVDPGRMPEMDGVDLSRLLTEPTRPLARYAYSESANLQQYSSLGTVTRKTDRLYVVTDQRWKLIYHQLRPTESELYDLESDPTESTNLFASETEARDRLLRELMRRDPLVRESGDAVDVPPELREKLESLGYIG